MAPSLQSRSSLLRDTSLDKGDAPVAEQLRAALIKNSVRVMDLFREWDENGDGTISKDEFRRAMPMLGMHAPDGATDEVFDSFDRDGGGTIDFRELNAQLKRDVRAEAARQPKKARVRRCATRTIRKKCEMAPIRW